MDSFYFNPYLDEYELRPRTHYVSDHSPRRHQRSERNNLPQPEEERHFVYGRRNDHLYRSYNHLRNHSHNCSARRTVQKSTPQASPKIRKGRHVQASHTKSDDEDQSGDEGPDLTISSALVRDSLRDTHHVYRANTMTTPGPLALSTCWPLRGGNDAESGNLAVHRRGGDGRRASHSDVSRQALYQNRRGSSPHDPATLQLHFGGHEVKDYNRNSSPHSLIPHQRSADETLLGSTGGLKRQPPSPTPSYSRLEGRASTDRRSQITSGRTNRSC